MKAITLLASAALTIMLVAGILMLAVDTAEAHAGPPTASASKKAVKRIPRPRQVQRQAQRVDSRRALRSNGAQRSANATKRTARSEQRQSAMGDGRRNAMSFGRSPVTSWSGWNRATASAGSASAPVKTVASSTMQVRFRSSRAK